MSAGFDFAIGAASERAAVEASSEKAAAGSSLERAAAEAAYGKNAVSQQNISRVLLGVSVIFLHTANLNLGGRAVYTHVH